MRKWLKIIPWIVFALFLVIQLFPGYKTNPPADGEINASDPVMAVLKRACFDCHSYQTRWPWYSYLAPAKWIIGRDVKKARAEMNFSIWNQYPVKKKNRLLEEIIEEVEAGHMPLPPYLIFHPNAKVLSGDLAVLKNWVHAFEKKKILVQPDTALGD